jgi:predicted alpha/beta superfamily hydrolase
MTRSLRTYAFIACALLSPVVGASAQQSQETRTGATFPNVTIPNTELRTLKSSQTGRDYDIYVNLPGGYTPTPEARLPGSGGAQKFLAFLKTELIPFVEANYRADPAQRVLLGSSLGGLFTLYVMFTEPALFSAYVSSSPAVQYGDRAAFKQEAAYAAKHKNLPVRLFLSVGELEDLAQPVKEFARTVAGRGYNGLKMESRVIEGERHSGNKPEAFNRGLRFVFRSE